MPKWFDVEVVSIRDLSRRTKEFRLLIIAQDVFQFEPGQFITIDLPVSDKRLERWKSYSLANLPGYENIIELAISRTTDGLGTKYLFENLKEGDQLRLKGPSGVFTLPTDLTRPLTMICTGTGIVPFRSMLSKIRKENIPFHDIHLIFGGRRDEDILYKDELEKMASDYPQFHYSVILSKDSYYGQQGYVHQLYLQYQPTYAMERIYYLCGWKEMIDEAKQNLTKKLGVNSDQIFYELYG